MTGKVREKVRPGSKFLRLRKFTATLSETRPRTVNDELNGSPPLLGVKLDALPSSGVT